MIEKNHKQGEVTSEFSKYVKAQTLACTEKSYLRNVILTLPLKKKFIRATEYKTFYKEREREQTGKRCFRPVAILKSIASSVTALYLVQYTSVRKGSTVREGC